MTTTAPSLGLHVQAFFGDYLTTQRALSQHTVLSYRDTFKLFLGFAARRRRKSVSDLGFADIGPDVVLAFLADLERSRKNSIRTRNTRLAALHTFFRYVAGHEPRVLDLCQRVNAIPVKKTRTTPAVYLEHDEVLHILSTIDRSTRGGRRDYLLVRLLFETGARAQEIASLRTTALRLSKPCQVHLFGKGRKERICPLRLGTAKLIRKHLVEHGVSAVQDAPLFIGKRSDPLTRHGVLRVVQRRTRQNNAAPRNQARRRPHLPPLGGHPPLALGQRAARHPKLAGSRQRGNDRPLHRDRHGNEAPRDRSHRSGSLTAAPVVEAQARSPRVA